jgi:hypothetical protein
MLSEVQEATEVPVLRTASRAHLSRTQAVEAAVHSQRREQEEPVAVETVANTHSRQHR